MLIGLTTIFVAFTAATMPTIFSIVPSAAMTNSGREPSRKSALKMIVLSATSAPDRSRSVLIPSATVTRLSVSIS